MSSDTSTAYSQASPLPQPLEEYASKYRGQSSSNRHSLSLCFIPKLPLFAHRRPLTAGHYASLSRAGRVRLFEDAAHDAALWRRAAEAVELAEDMGEEQTVSRTSAVSMVSADLGFAAPLWDAPPPPHNTAGAPYSQWPTLHQASPLSGVACFYGQVGRPDPAPVPQPFYTLGSGAALQTEHLILATFVVAQYTIWGEEALLQDRCAELLLAEHGRWSEVYSCLAP